MSEPIDPLTGHAPKFSRDATKPLDDFFAQLMRDHSFRAEREAAEAFRQPGPKGAQSR